MSDELRNPAPEPLSHSAPVSNTLDAKTVLNGGNGVDRRKQAGFAVVCLGLFGGLAGYFLSGDDVPTTAQEAPPTSTYAQIGSKGRGATGKTFDYAKDDDSTSASRSFGTDSANNAASDAGTDPDQSASSGNASASTPPTPPGGEKKPLVERARRVILDRSSSSLSSQGGPGSGSGGLGLVPKAPNVPATGGVFDLYAQQQAAQSGLNGATSNNSGALGAMLSPTQTDSQVAARLFNRDYLLAKGAYLDCVLNTRLNSTVPGMTKCTLTRDVYSDNGATLLLERGSEVIGEYRSNLTQGQTRLFVLWDRVKTPHGVVVNLASPGTDSLGGSGVPGYVETHFWQRFGGAMMLSLVDDLASYAANKGSGSDGVTFDSSSDTAQSMAAEALKNTINIPPTFYKNQGERVGIFIARDIDFSRVYHLQVNH